MNGWTCPECGERLYVWKSPRVKDEVRVKPYRCRKCGFYGETEERPRWEKSPPEQQKTPPN